MDHFHILDAYRSNISLVMLDPEKFDAMPEDQRFDRVYKAAYQTKEKYDQLVKQERIQAWALTTVQAMVVVMALLFTTSVWYAGHSRGIKISYTFIVMFLFSILGIVIYLVMFSRRIKDSQTHRKTFEEIYRMDVEEASKAYNAAAKLREKEIDIMEEGEWSCSKKTDDKFESMKKQLKTQIGVSFRDEAAGMCTEGILLDAIRNGIMYTMTDDSGALIDDMVATLRTALGSETYRVIEESDAYDIIDAVIVPMMLKAKESIYHGSTEGRSHVDDGQCGKFCEDTIEKLVADTLDPSKTASASMLDDAWEKCRKDMEDVCKSERLRSGASRCAFGCSKMEQTGKAFSTIDVSRRAPGANWIKQSLDPEQTEDGATVSTERTCIDAALANPDVDAVYFGQSQPGGARECFFHFSSGSEATGRGVFDPASGEDFSGKLLYKEEHNVDVPGGTPNAVARNIADEVLSVNAAFELDNYDVYVYDALRSTDLNFKANSDFYKGVFEDLVQMLKPETSKVSDFLIPDIERLNTVLAETPARKFRIDYIWSVAKASVFLHIRHVRLDQKMSYATETNQDEIRRKHRLALANFAMGVISSMISYYVFTAERESAKSKTGKITLYSLIFDMWHRHLVAMSVILMFWSIIYSWLIRENAKKIFNETMREKNTIEFMMNVYKLRDFLFGLTNTLPRLVGETGPLDLVDERKVLMQAVHTGNINIVNQFSSPDTNMNNVLTVAQKNEFIRLSQGVVKAYDRCNNIDAEAKIPFPMPEVIVYSTSIIVLLLGMSYLYSRFDIAEVAKRVERVRSLRPKVYMGDTAAAYEIGGLLECAENSVDTRLDVMKNVFVGMIGVMGIMITVMLVNSNDDYISAMNSGFMFRQKRCVL